MRVVVIGGGPAGATAAMLLARQGANVVLLEAKTFPRDKTCGDGLPPRALFHLSKLGISLPSQSGQAVESFRMISPGGEIYCNSPPADYEYGSRGLVIPRKALDYCLAQGAAQAGAEVRENQRVEAVSFDDGVTIRVRGRSEPLRADVVLGCDGFPSVVRKNLQAPSFPKRHLLVGVRAYFELPGNSSPNVVTAMFPKNVLPGYLWIFPLPGGRANVGLCIRADHLARRSPEKLSHIFQNTLQSPYIAAEMEGATCISPLVGHYLPLATFARHLVFDRALLLGDAAGFINPFTGEGIDLAIDSAIQAAETIQNSEARGDFSKRSLSEYATKCQRSFLNSILAVRRLLPLFSFPRLLDRTIRTAGHSESLQRTLFSTVFGEPISPLSAIRAIGGVIAGTPKSSVPSTLKTSNTQSP